MSSLGGSGGILGRIVEGAQTALGRLAQFYRLPGFAAIEPPIVPDPARPVLRTPEEIAAALAAHQLAPPRSQQPRYNSFYICIATDLDTGVVLARIPHDIEHDANTPRSTIYSRARQNAMRRLPYYLPGEDVSQRNIGWTCRLVRRTQINIP